MRGRRPLYETMLLVRALVYACVCVVFFCTNALAFLRPSWRAHGEARTQGRSNAMSLLQSKSNCSQGDERNQLPKSSLTRHACVAGPLSCELLYYIVLGLAGLWGACPGCCWAFVCWAVATALSVGTFVLVNLSCLGSCVSRSPSHIAQFTLLVTLVIHFQVAFSASVPF